MSVLVKGVQMPSNCGKCFVGDRTICHDKCPLVEVPTPHGMLIDGDELYREVAKAHAYEHLSVKRIIAMIRKSPTVIEAEE